ncbi:Flavin-containing monooxygenase [Quillaja saponaria]|uniref:Flavin-containing monooxygenase n=1 Tax=Quillaja saponaria TaxID=32244 RepID=A0AAD7P7R8_QUISA|nr:Flavin-containing monooxygenase [Quillaja saponaria]
MEKVAVVIVGAGPSGLATSACLALNSIPYIILEKDDCSASLWRKNTYDRVNLHLAKEFCSLPHFPHPPTAPTFLSKKCFLEYIDKYVEKFNINPQYCRLVESAIYDEDEKKWRIEAKNTQEEEKIEVYESEFLVIATGENSEGFIPNVPGLDEFEGEIIHSKHYKMGSKYENKDVLVVGCGNSGMEIAYDLSNYGACPSIVIRSPVHIFSKELIHRGMTMLSYLPVHLVDALITLLAELDYGDLSKYGIRRPTKGPFYLKELTGRSAVIDVGTIKAIKNGKIKVVPAEVVRINKKTVIFKDNFEKEFDVIVFATGYKSIANSWLKDYMYCLNDTGMPKNSVPNHWKGEKGLYCAGLSRRGLFGVSMDAEAIAHDINKIRLCLGDG